MICRTVALSFFSMSSVSCLKKEFKNVETDKTDKFTEMSERASTCVRTCVHVFLKQHYKKCTVRVNSLGDKNMKHGVVDAQVECHNVPVRLHI